MPTAHAHGASGALPQKAIPLGKLPRDYRTNMGPCLVDCYQKYGPLFRVLGLSGECIFMIGPEANRTVLLTHRQAFSHAVGWGHMFGTGEQFGHGLLALDGAVHAEHRRMMTPAFTVGHMDRYLPVMQRIIRECVHAWAARGTVDVYEEARRLTFAVAAETLGGLAPGPEVDEFSKAYAQLIDLRVVPAVQARNQDWYARRDFLLDRVKELLMPRIAERRVRPADEALGMLVAARDSEGRGLTDEQLIAHTNTLLIAGHETSASLSAWLLYLLSEHPEYTARVRAEQEEVLGNRDEPTAADLLHMKTLTNALSETERLYPPIANGARGVLNDVPFGEYLIPAGARVLYSIIGSHYLPSVWEAPERFDPDRFAPPREEDRRTPYALVGFGGGPRICLGINFAKLEIKALATHLLRHYQLTLVPGQVIYQRYDVSGFPVNGITLRLMPRR
jgi:cytochrome P450